MPSERTHPRVPPTKANCEEDHRDKVKLNAEFAAFKAVVNKSAKTSPEVRKLIVPLIKLEKAIIVAAFGKHFVTARHEKKQRS
jgi:hypothetical protein